MKIVYQHLLNFLRVKPSIGELSDRLFQLGHEHEILDGIFDMEFTPNRGDCLSLLGLARDLNVFYESNLALQTYQEDINPLDLDFINKEKTKCPEISFLNIEIENNIFEYKDYLNNYFNDLKINKNNFFTDVSNYIAYEMGQPTHCYDFESIKGNISLESNTGSSNFQTLLGKNIDINGPDLVFTNQGNIINLAGIVGGIDTSCSQNTTKALVECAYFLPESIIGKAVKYDLHSDASHKFERGVDPNCHEIVLRRFVQIVQEHTKIVKLEIYRSSNNKLKDKKLDLDIKIINKVLGLDISKELYVDSLTKLGFNIDKNIKIPSYRSDINQQNDLAEEVARVIGYDNIPLKNIKLPKIVKNNKITNEAKIKNFLINNGFHEVINSSFYSTGNKDSIKIDNPLDSNRSFMRKNLTSSLIESLIYNEKRQKDSIKLFEISDVYFMKDNNIEKEKRLALAISGRQGLNHKDFSKTLDQNYLISLFKGIQINIEKDVTLINRDKLDSKIKIPIFAIEINLDSICSAITKFDEQTPALKFNNFIKYIPISEYPSSYRDFSFSINDPSYINEVINKLNKSKANNLKELFMFDFYENKELNLIKIGYRFIFQSHTKTLTDIEIDQSVEQLLLPILSIDSVSLPRASK